MRAAWAVLAAAALAACAPVGDGDISEQWKSVAIEASPVTFPASQVGELVFRGGVALRSDVYEFGGLSGLEVLDGDHFLAVSDGGDWFEGRIVLDAQGTLTGVADLRTAQIRDEHGRPYNGRDEDDSEELAQLPDGRFAVSFEQRPRIMIYDFNRDGPFGAASAGPVLAGVERLPPNVGLEAMAATADGALLAGAEGGGAPTPLWRARLNAATPVQPFAHFVLRDGFSLTSMDRLPDGGFVALERFYAPVIGARARIATFDADALQEGAMLAPHVLAELAPPMPVDNFEGISAVAGPNGATRLYIVSDDNFSAQQRTLLLAFDIVQN